MSCKWLKGKICVRVVEPAELMENRQCAKYLT